MTVFNFDKTLLKFYGHAPAHVSSHLGRGDQPSSHYGKKLHPSRSGFSPLKKPVEPKLKEHKRLWAALPALHHEIVLPF